MHYNDKVYHIENDINHKSKTRNVKDPIVFANHSKYTNKYGYNTGKRGMSSYLREKLTDQELQSILNYTKLTLGKSNAEIYDMILSHAMNSNYDNINVKNHQYRDKKQFLVENPDFDENKIVMKTTGQILQNFDDLEFVYRYDKNNSINIPKYINRLPKSYNPKIRVIIQETQKNKRSKKTSLTNKKICEIEKKFITKDSEQVKNAPIFPLVPFFKPVVAYFFLATIFLGAAAAAAAGAGAADDMALLSVGCTSSSSSDSESSTSTSCAADAAAAEGTW